MASLPQTAAHMSGLLALAVLVSADDSPPPSMTTVATTFCFQAFDDSFYFQRLTLIDICCGPPVAR